VCPRTVRTYALPHKGVTAQYRSHECFMMCTENSNKGLDRGGCLDNGGKDSGKRALRLKGVK